jgi:hypothetical protein
MLVGAAGTMFIGDIFTELEGSARTLARSSSHPEEQARLDVYRWHAPSYLIPALGACFVLIASAVALKGVGM